MGFFRRKDTPTIMDGWVVRYKVDTSSPHLYDGEISGGRNGVLIQGSFSLITEAESLQRAIKTLVHAYLQYQELKRDRYIFHSEVKPIPEEGLPGRHLCELPEGLRRYYEEALEKIELARPKQNE